MALKKILKRIVYGHKANSRVFIRYMRSLGAQIGEGCTIYSPTKTLIDLTRPWLLKIGNNVKITEGVSILTHGYDGFVLNGVYGEILGSSGQVEIGNNVFVGVNTTILKGVHIGNNVIIGANTLVNKDVQDNCVVAGNPCRVIMSIEKYYEKRKQAQVSEAQELVRLYRECYKREPDEKALHEFFWLFMDENDFLPKCWEKMIETSGNKEYTRKKFKENKKKYENKTEFLESIK